MMMGDLGAEVIKVEPPDGDPMRAMGPHFLAGESVYYLSTNRGKKGVALDLRLERGRQVFYDLVKVSERRLRQLSPGCDAKIGN